MLVYDENDLNGTEILQVYGSSQLIAVEQLAKFINSSSVIYQKIIDTGNSYTSAVAGIFVGWKSSSSSDKSLTIPASTGFSGTVIVSDLLGTAGTYPINVVPVSGAIIGLTSVYTDFGSITLLDTVAGWCSI